LSLVVAMLNLHKAHLFWFYTSEAFANVREGWLIFRRPCDEQPRLLKPSILQALVSKTRSLCFHVGTS
jgi:hypothetical protein